MTPGLGNRYNPSTFTVGADARPLEPVPEASFPPKYFGGARWADAPGVMALRVAQS